MIFRHFLAAASAGLLAACAASNPPNYYTLVPGARNPDPAAAARIDAQVIDLRPVIVPAPMDMPQIVARTGQGEVVLLESERWAGPLADEVRSALAAKLVARLGVPVVQDLPADRPGRALLVQVEVQRFDSVLGKQATLDAVWRVRKMAGPEGDASDSRANTSLVCRSSYFATPAGEGVPALVQAHQRNVAALGDAITAAAGAVSAGQPVCPSTTLSE